MLQNTRVWFLIFGQSVTCVFAQEAASPPKTPIGSAYVQRMMSLDRDKDGFLSASELPGKLSEMLKKHDKNGDNRLGRLELARIEDDAISARDSGAGKSARQAARQRRGGRRAGAAGGSPLDAKQILRFALTFDKDKDGGLSAEELQLYAQALAGRRAQAKKLRDANSKSTEPDSEKRPAAGLGASEDPAQDPFGAPPGSPKN